MTQREKTLAIAVLVLVGLWGGSRLWNRFGQLLADRRRQVTEARQQVADLQLEIARGKQAGEKLREWQRRSLPAAAPLAAALYRSALLERLERARMNVENIEPDPNLARTDAYQAIGFSIRARGTLMQLTSFLVAFYESPPLQKITLMRITPLADGDGARDLSVTLRVEGLSVQGTANTELPRGSARTLARGKRINYLQAIVNRDLFARKEPPAEEPAESAEPAAPAPEDELQLAYITGIVPSGDKLQVWITLQKTREVLRLFAGDEFRIGPTRGEILAVKPGSVIVLFEDRRHQVNVGRHLRQGTLLEEAPASEPPG